MKSVGESCKFVVDFLLNPRRLLTYKIFSNISDKVLQVESWKLLHFVFFRFYKMKYVKIFKLSQRALAKQDI